MTRSRKRNSSHTFVDLFAGCGGLSLGLEQAGFSPVFASELNAAALETYLMNRRDSPLLNEKYHCRDVKQLIDAAVLKNLRKALLSDYGISDIDLVVGGPPCQGFSGIGHRRSYSVERKQLPSNLLFQDMAYVVHKLRPKIFLFENVRGLRTARWTKGGERGEIWEDVQNAFRSIPGYEVRADLLFAKDYGVPQNRPRLFLVGVRKDIGVKLDAAKPAAGLLPDQIGGYPTIPELLSDLIDRNYGPGGKTPKYPRSALSDIQRQLRVDPKSGRVKRKGELVTEHEYSRHSVPVMKKFEYMINNNGEIAAAMRTRKFAQRVLPIVWTDKGPTITATSLPDDYVHFSQPRSLTVREWARIQTFPDWYAFRGPRTTGGLRRAGNPRKGIHSREVPKYTQIGNAVPVKLAHELGKHFRRLLQ